ncbi:MAG: 50S ribosomal protein L24e [Candidatus Odinarchaeia archaeon]
MVKIFKCAFCGEDIEPGTGLIYFKSDGSSIHFCSSKCRKNLLVLKRKSRKLKWTKHYPRKSMK